MVALLLLLAGCPGPASKETAETGEPPFVPTLPTGGCGLAPYDWLPATDMGQIVDWEEVDEWAMTADAIGALLAMLDQQAFSEVPYGVTGLRVRYVTQDRGAPVEATAMVALPDVPGTYPLMISPHGTSGFTDACAPSAGTIEDVGFNLLFASLGYVVVAPDYLGMNGMGAPAGFVHPYMVPEATAVATLDAGRAMLRLQDQEALEVRGDPSRTILWGGSEGGYAVLWADRYGAGYAPEFHVVATAALVPPTDVTALALHGLTVPGSTSAAVAAAWATHHDWYRMEAPLSEILTDADPRYIATNLPVELMAGCDDFPSVDGISTLEELYQPAALQAGAAGDLSSLDPWACTLSISDLHATAIPRGSDAPVLIQLSGADTLVIPEYTRDDLPVLCDQGYHIEHLECEGASHTDGAVNSIPYQAAWIQARLAGEALPAEADCVVNAPVDCADFLDGTW